jgi:acetyl esterase/lipase
VAKQISLVAGYSKCYGNVRPMNARTLLSPEFASLLEGFDVRVDAEMLSQARASLPGLGSTQAVKRSEHRVPGDPEIPLRIHRPRGAPGPLPCVFSIHGGGFVVGSYNMDDLRFESWCSGLSLLGASVEYRLAPETPYPGPIDDCYRGLKWVYDNADELGVDRSRIGVYGVSAGGALAAGLCLLARDRGEIPLAFQLLESPMLDDRQNSPSSRLDGLAIWSKEANEFGWRSYLGESYGGPDIEPYAVPARSADLTRLPPSFVSVGAADGFRDEDVDYALRLNQASVPTELHVYPGAPHGYQMFTDSAVARQGARDADDWLARVSQ